MLVLPCVLYLHLILMLEVFQIRREPCVCLLLRVGDRQPCVIQSLRKLSRKFSSLLEGRDECENVDCPGCYWEYRDISFC